MVYNSRKGSGFHGDLFGTLTRTFKPIAEGVADVGANLATGLVSDLLSGKTPKASIKERGNQAKGLVAQRALQKLQGGRGTKRKRSSSKSQPSKKRKQTGGRIFPPPVHYPGGNYPGYDMIGRGIFSKMRNRMEKDCEDWYKRQQKGGRVRKRKPKKQTAAGKKRKPRKQKGSGKQTGAGKKRKSRKQTGDGLWSGLKEIFQ